jgi:hypothetical protein
MKQRKHIFDGSQRPGPQMNSYWYNLVKLRAATPQKLTGNVPLLEHIGILKTLVTEVGNIV